MKMRLIFAYVARPRLVKLLLGMVAASFLGTIVASNSAHSEQTKLSPTVSEEMKHGAEELLDALSAWAAQHAGETPNPAAGVLTSLLANSGDLICEAWIIAGNRILTDLTIKDADPVLIDKAQKLFERIQAACAE